jgi:FlaA1/EpsC-like NDP-sugar epimerase
MGATKRVAELIVQNLAVDGGTRCSVVRFGNVLGSNGSVAPLFLDQIKKGGPVTVTHPDVRRYFMLIPEAVQLVLHAATLDDNGAIHVLDMGGEFKILDLARNLIRLAGYLPDEEIQIEFIGLRPGEKLSETLIGDGETLEATGREKTWRVCSNARRWASDELMIEVAGIEATAAQGTRADVIASLGRLVPTFATPVPQIVQIKGK